MLDEREIFPRQPTNLLRNDRLLELLVLVIFDEAPDKVLVISQDERQKLVLTLGLKNLVGYGWFHGQRSGLFLGPFRSFAQIRLGFGADLFLLQDRRDDKQRFGLECSPDSIL